MRTRRWKILSSSFEEFIFKLRFSVLGSRFSVLGPRFSFSSSSSSTLHITLRHSQSSPRPPILRDTLSLLLDSLFMTLSSSSLHSRLFADAPKRSHDAPKRSHDAPKRIYWKRKKSFSSFSYFDHHSLPLFYLLSFHSSLSLLLSATE